VCCKFNNRIVISNIINNKYTTKKLTVKSTSLLTPYSMKAKTKSIEKKNLKIVDNIIWYIDDEIKKFISFLKTKSIKIL